MAISRRDEWVVDALGRAQAGANVTYYTQPGLALATVFANSDGSATTSNPLIADGLGHAVAYLTDGTYTIFYSGAQIQGIMLSDQSVGGGSSTGDYTTVPIVPTGLVNGVGATGNRSYALPSAPLNPSASLYFVNRGQQAYGVDYSIAGSVLTIIAPLPLQIGDVHELFYS